MKIKSVVDTKAEIIRSGFCAVGEMSRQVTQCYEGLFTTFYQELTQALTEASSMSEAADIANSLVDVAVEALRASFPGMARYECKAGCNSCCHLFVAVPPGSAVLIADHVQSQMGEDEQQALRDRLLVAASALEAAADPTQVRIRCPLLGDDDRCAVYSVRPLACRAFTSKSVALCQAVIFGTDPSEGRGIDQNPSHYRLHKDATLALVEAARARGLDARQRGLVPALLNEL